MSDVLTGLLYHLPTSNTGGTTLYPFGTWAVYEPSPPGGGSSIEVATTANPRGWEVALSGTTLDVLIGPWSGTMTVTWFVNSSLSYVATIRTVQPAPVATEVMRYVYDFAVTVPGTTYLDSPWHFEWRFTDGRAIEGLTTRQEVPDPLAQHVPPAISYAGLVSGYVVDGQGNEHHSLVSTELVEEFCSHGCTDMGGGLVVPNTHIDDVTPGFNGTMVVGNISRYVRRLEGDAIKFGHATTLNHTMLVPAKNLCIWERRDGVLFYSACTASNSTLGTEVTSVYRSLDGGREWDKMADIWPAGFRDGITIGLPLSRGAFSAAIKTATNPSEVWARVSPDGLDWSATPVLVGTLVAPFKEPLSLYQDSTGALFIMTPNRQWWSQNGGVSWGLLP